MRNIKVEMAILAVAVATTMFSASCSKVNPAQTVFGQPLAQVAPKLGAYQADPDADVASSPQDQQTTNGNDNSKIVTKKDENGNLMQIRTFDKDPVIRNIVVETSADSSKIGTIFLKSGESKELSGDDAAKALTLSGSELAMAFGLRQFVPDIAPQAEPVATTVAELNETPASAVLPQVVQSTVAERTETKSELKVESSPKTEDERVRRIQGELNRLSNGLELRQLSGGPR